MPATPWALAESFLASSPGGAARVLEAHSAADAAAFLGKCKPAAAASVLTQMDPGAVDACLTVLPADTVSRVLISLPAVQVARALRRLAPGVQERLLETLPAAHADAARRGLAYIPDTAGALMDPRVPALPEDLRVQEARRRLRKGSCHDDDVWVVSRNGVLRGAMRVRDLFFADGRSPLDRLVDTSVGHIAPGATRAAVVAHPSWRQRSALPVVDEAGQLLGVIRAGVVREEESPATRPSTAGPMSAGLAVGELYWVTATHLLRTFLGDPGKEDSE